MVVVITLVYPAILPPTIMTAPTSAVSRPNPASSEEMIPYLARAAVAVGVDGLFMEVHPRPDEALSDGPNSIALKDLKEMLKGLKALNACVKTIG